MVITLWFSLSTVYIITLPTLHFIMASIIFFFFNTYIPSGPMFRFLFFWFCFIFFFEVLYSKIISGEHCRVHLEDISRVPISIWMRNRSRVWNSSVVIHRRGRLLPRGRTILPTDDGSIALSAEYCETTPPKRKPRLNMRNRTSILFSQQQRKKSIAHVRKFKFLQTFCSNCKILFKKKNKREKNYYGI